MLISCWSAKGGCGTTVVASALALLLARSAGAALLADLAGDVPAALGLAEPAVPGLAEWLVAGPSVAADALTRLEVPAADGLTVLPLGQVALTEGGRAALLASLLAADHRPVVVDCGSAPVGARLELAMAGTASLLVTRPCYLSLRRAAASPLRPSGVILVEEKGRALQRDDVESVLGVPVRAVVMLDEAVARAVDAGLLATRLPRGLARSLRHAA